MIVPRCEHWEGGRKKTPGEQIFFFLPFTCCSDNNLAKPEDSQELLHTKRKVPRSQPQLTSQRGSGLLLAALRGVPGPSQSLGASRGPGGCVAPWEGLQDCKQGRVQEQIKITSPSSLGLQQISSSASLRSQVMYYVLNSDVI